jgi:hypothetical protein
MDKKFTEPLANRILVIYIVLRIGKLNTMIKNFANNFFFEAEASAEAYFAYSVRC